ncbi:MAG: hypothetical protein R3C46_07640 [Hyphomonadaceae bacterium]
MRTAILSLSALALAACGGEAEKPADTTPAADTMPADANAGHGAMDSDMMAADMADDANTDETPDGFMFHTDTSKIESIHLPTAAGVTWTATPEDPAQVSIVSASDETMPDGTVHHVIKVQPMKSGVIAKVKLEKHDSAEADAPVTETRTVNVMIH